jgi:hypothetical protein
LILCSREVLVEMKMLKAGAVAMAVLVVAGAASGVMVGSGVVWPMPAQIIDGAAPVAMVPPGQLTWATTVPG